MRLRQRQRHLPAEFTSQSIMRRRPDSLLAATVLTGQVLRATMAAAVITPTALSAGPVPGTGQVSRQPHLNNHTWSSFQLRRSCPQRPVEPKDTMTSKRSHDHLHHPSPPPTITHTRVHVSVANPFILCLPHWHSSPMRSWIWGSPSGGSDGKQSACNGLGRSPGKQNGYPLQYPCLENPLDRGTWQATVQGVTKSQTRLSN